MNFSTEQPILFKINKNVIVARDPQLYSSFPWAIEDGQKIHVVFRQASIQSVTNSKCGKLTHHDLNSWVSKITSYDQGQSWHSKDLVELFNSEYGINDPAITNLTDGDIILRITEVNVTKSEERGLLQGKITSHRADLKQVSKILGNRIIRFNSDFSQIKETTKVEIANFTESCSRDPVIELSDGSLLLSVYKGAPYQTDSSYLVRSFDGGRTWNDIVTIAGGATNNIGEYQGPNYNETSVLPLDNSNIIAMIRTDTSFHLENEFMPVGGVGNLHLSKSFNNGLSWTTPIDTGIYGQPPHLLRISNSMILCTYGYRKFPYGIRATVSFDNGSTWNVENEIILRDDGFHWDLGYPMTIPLKNNKYFTIYYFNDSELNRFIAGTLWEIIY